MAIAHVQTSALKINTNAGTVTQTINWTAGNLGVIYVFTHTATTSMTISSVADNVGNTFSSAVTDSHNADRRVAIYYLENLLGGSTTVTATFSGLAGTNGLCLSEYSGVLTSGALEKTGDINGGSNTTPSVTLNPTNSNSLYVGFFHQLGVDTITFTVGSGETERMNHGGSFPGLYIEDQIGSSGSQAINCTLSSAAFWDALGATFIVAPAVSNLNPEICVVGGMIY